jgi:hypothetical protein
VALATMTTKLLAFTKGEFIFWVAVAVVATLVAALLLGGWKWLSRRVRAWWAKRRQAKAVRSALIDVRSELESARRILQEASERKSFWNPEAQEHLPVQVWDAIQPSVNEDIHAEATAAIDDAYQQMHRLNQLALSRVEEAKQERGQGIRRPPGWTLDFDFYENDTTVLGSRQRRGGPHRCRDRRGR